MSKEARRTTQGLTPEIAETIQELAALVARERFGPDGQPPLKTAFSTIEEIGHQVGRHVATEVDAELTARRAPTRPPLGRPSKTGPARVGRAR